MYFIIIVAQKFLVRIFCVGMLFLAAASARASALASAADSAVANADPSGFAGFDLNQTREVLSHEPVDSPADNLQQFLRPGLRPGLRLDAKGRRLCGIPHRSNFYIFSEIMNTASTESLLLLAECSQAPASVCCAHLGKRKRVPRRFLFLQPRIIECRRVRCNICGMLPLLDVSAFFDHGYALLRHIR